MLQTSPLVIGSSVQNVSELERQLAGHPFDTAKVNLLVRLGEYYCSRDFEKALLYLQDALVLSTELHYKQGMAASLF